MTSKGKARADEVQETDDDAYGSDDPFYLPNARAGDEDGATQGSPKGHKRIQQAKGFLFEPLVGRGWVRAVAKSFSPFQILTPFSSSYVPGSIVRVRSRSTAQLSYLRPCRIFVRVLISI
jgi:hypothetical protein